MCASFSFINVTICWKLLLLRWIYANGFQFQHSNSHLFKNIQWNLKQKRTTPLLELLVLNCCHTLSIEIVSFVEKLSSHRTNIVSIKQMSKKGININIAKEDWSKRRSLETTRDNVNARFRWRKYRFWLKELNYWINKMIKTWFESGLYTNHVMMIRHRLSHRKSNSTHRLVTDNCVLNSIWLKCVRNWVLFWRDHLSQSPKAICIRCDCYHYVDRFTCCLYVTNYSVRYSLQGIRKQI